MIGHLPINIPQEVNISLNNRELIVNGPLGVSNLLINEEIELVIVKEDGKISLNIGDNTQLKRLRGTIRSKINNMIMGVTEGYEVNLQIEGIGYRVEKVGEDKLEVYVGKSHSIGYNIPKGVKVEVNGNNMTVKGIEKDKVTKVAAEIRDIKRPEPYKGKGIRYLGESLKLKTTKKK